MTGQTANIHNLFLTYGAELGLIGLSLWIVVFVLGVGGALVNRGPPDMRVWRIGLGAYALFFLIVANAVFPQAFPNLILWAWAGVSWPAPTAPRTARSCRWGAPSARRRGRARGAQPRMAARSLALASAGGASTVAVAARSSCAGLAVGRRGTTRAGLPAATIPSGTSRATTAPAPITQSAPIVTPGRMIAPAPT